ncbi:MAG: hypothetical protein ACRCZJ_00435 [Erysipelotrichaceae bacterium]
MIQIQYLINDACASCYQMHETLNTLKSNFPEIEIVEVPWQETMIEKYDLKRIPVLLVFHDGVMVQTIDQNLPYEILELYFEDLVKEGKK